MLTDNRIVCSSRFKSVDGTVRLSLEMAVDLQYLLWKQVRLRQQ